MSNYIVKVCIEVMVEDVSEDNAEAKAIEQLSVDIYDPDTEIVREIK